MCDNFIIFNQSKLHNSFVKGRMLHWIAKQRIFKMNLEVDLIAGVIKGGPPPKNLPAPRLIKIFIAGERNGLLF